MKKGKSGGDDEVTHTYVYAFTYIFLQKKHVKCTVIRSINMNKSTAPRNAEEEAIVQDEDYYDDTMNTITTLRRENEELRRMVNNSNSPEPTPR